MVYKSALFQFAVLFLILQQGESCDDGWMQDGGNCYKIFTERTNKSVAETTCLKHKSALASMSNVDEEKFLLTQLNLANTSEQNFWVGLHKIENVLIWNNRAPVGSLRPMVDVPSTQESSDCFVYNGAKVVSFDCSAEASFVCEQWKLTDVKPTSCPQGTHKDVISDKCFWYTHIPLTKAGSEVICTLKHGGLLTMRGIFFPLNIAMILLISPPPVPRPIVMWTSLSVKNGSFVYEDETEFKRNDFKLRPGDGECVALVVERGSPYELHQKPCLEEALGFCESSVDFLTPDFSSIFGVRNNNANPGTAQCPVGSNWQEHDETGFCYWETSYETPRLSWEDARNYCKSYGGDLASVHSTQEEKIGLGFQFGSVEHSYWIGLYYDADLNDYLWGDGTTLDYINWEDGQPNHGDRRMRCALMNSIKKKWQMAYCGSLNWFICKAPKQISPPTPVPPTPEPLVKCAGSSVEYFYKGYCYQRVAAVRGWHRAQQYCENLGSNLVSLHSEQDVDFVIRLMAAPGITVRGNRVWIGLNSLGIGGAFKWTDGTPFEFANWDANEPNNFQNQEKCVNMYSLSGMWNDENCNSVMGFICKRRNSTVPETVSTTTAPMVGNCKKDWYKFAGRCFLPVGAKQQDRRNWTEAGMHCFRKGGYLASIKDPRDQAFMYYVMQDLKMDTWIGLHDSIHSGVFFWTDNSPLFYTNWAQGEPSTQGLEENCVALNYGRTEGGKWKDTECKKELPFVCQTSPDPSITIPSGVRGTRCLHPNGYMKLGLSCYNMFTNLSSWEDAEAICVKDGAHLVSIYDMENQAVVNYLAATSPSENDTFWIGIQSNGNSQLKWVNGWSMPFTRWGNNEPQEIGGQKTCFYTTISGYWKGAPCSEKKQFICLKTADEPPTVLTPTNGNCPKSYQWTALGNACMFFGMRYTVEWYTANFHCSLEGANLASFHSITALNEVQTYLRDATKLPLFIGLTKNSEGGFEWADRSPVDFVNWDQGEPQEGAEFRCVEMRLDNMKWRVVSCDSRRYYICGKRKEYSVSPTSMELAKTTGKDSSTKSDEVTGLQPGALTAIVIVFLIIVIAAAVALFHFRPWEKNFNRYRVHSSEPVTSFENATYSDEPNSINFNDRHVLYPTQ